MHGFSFTFSVSNKKKNYEHDDLFTLFFEEYGFLRQIFLFLKLLIRSDSKMKNKISSVAILMFLVAYI